MVCQNLSLVPAMSSESGPGIIQSKFNTVYRHSILDILTYYADIPTDPNPDNDPLNTKYSHDTPRDSASATFVAKKEDNVQIRNVKAKSVELDQITISFKHPLVNMEMLRPIAFDSKCNSWKEVEQKMIEMSKEAAANRGLSHIRVSGISYPTSIFNLILILLVLLLPFGFKYPDLLYDRFFAKYLPFMLVLKTYHNAIFYTTICIHFAELYILMLPRVRKFRVPLDYAIEWSLLTILDGYNSVKRFDEYLEHLRSDDVYYDFTETDYFL
ncbi:hypothetical protein CANINC_001750 [Pichia inconspicua]|uniref:DUF2470 domain-containing protein n=1 Tax=Pichia inconspicua TaxID=52247 RepID=A0A4T0X2T8_9ASCO|nr:hypothetical protein CANINC_001750 [[Candida] inconspicua]